MRRGRDEALAGRVELGELAAHVVEGAREVPELVGAVDGEARAEVARGDPARARLDAAHVPRDALGDEEAREQREGEQDLALDKVSVVAAARTSTVRLTGSMRSA